MLHLQAQERIKRHLIETKKRPYLLDLRKPVEKMSSPIKHKLMVVHPSDPVKLSLVVALNIMICPLASATRSIHE